MKFRSFLNHILFIESFHGDYSLSEMNRTEEVNENR
jgi:hypothetical protein